MLDLKYLDKVAVLKLDLGVTNAINLEVINKLAKVLKALKTDTNVHALVLSSTNDKFFSIGFDIPQLYYLSKEDFKLFYERFNERCMELYTFPKPTVAAITGHAIAGGFILALCCDYRIIGKGRKLMGLNEIKLGVPVPYLADSVLQSLVGIRNSREIVESGEFYHSEESLQMGMVDQVLPLEDVLLKSIEKVRLIGSIPQDTYRIIKRNRVEVTESQIRAHWKEKQRSFIECWYSKETRELLREAMKKF